MRVVLATPRRDLRDALMLFLSDTAATVTGSSVDTKGLLALTAATVPDVAIVDWRLQEGGATKVVKRLRNIHQPLRVIVLGSHPEDESAAIAAGADTYLVVGDRPEGLASALGVLLPRDVRQGEAGR